MPLNIVFMGTPKFSLTSLDLLKKKNFNILAVYTQPPQKSKRGQKINPSPIEEFCKKKNIKFYNPPSLNNEDELKIFKKLSPDIVIVVAYGQLIPKIYLGLPKFGFINIHASLLPKWRGAAPIQRAIINGDKKIGVSLMKIEEKLDSGPILISKEMELDQNLTHGEVEKKLAVMGANLLAENLTKLKEGNIKFTPQVHSKATYAKKIEKNETKINWNLDATKVLRHIHGLSPNPGAWFKHESERYKVLRASKSLSSGNPGTILDESLTIACKSGSIEILEIQRQGKNKQAIKDFLLGKKINKGTVLT